MENNQTNKQIQFAEYSDKMTLLRSSYKAYMNGLIDIYKFQESVKILSESEIKIHIHYIAFSWAVLEAYKNNKI